MRFDYCVVVVRCATCLFYALFIARGLYRVCVSGRRRARNVEKYFIIESPLYVQYYDYILYYLFSVVYFGRSVPRTL